MRISGRSARSSGRHWGLLEQVRLCCRDYAVLPLLTRSVLVFVVSIARSLKFDLVFL